MKLIALIVLIWVICLAIGAALGILGKIIWLAVLGTIIAGLWNYMSKDKDTTP